VSFLYEWSPDSRPQENAVSSPFDAEVLQAFRTTDNRQFLKLGHNDGLVSTISFMGQTKGLKPGDEILAGQKLGDLSPMASGLTWQVGQAGT
jgi:hypothetical protein